MVRPAVDIPQAAWTPTTTLHTTSTMSSTTTSKPSAPPSTSNFYIPYLIPISEEL